MSQFSTGYRTMERQEKEFHAETTFSDSETLLQSAPSTPDTWRLPSQPNVRDSGGSRGSSTGSKGTRASDKVHFTTFTSDIKRGPGDHDDVEPDAPVKEDFPDWRRSAVLTVFIFPPTGLLAMVLACLSHRSAKKGDIEQARRLNCCSCWLVFISLLASLIIITFIILLRLYGYIEDPFR